MPPPRRRRRSRRPLPPEPGPDATSANVTTSSADAPEDESEDLGHYSQLATPRPRPPDYEDVASKNSDDEFIAVMIYLYFNIAHRCKLAASHAQFTTASISKVSERKMEFTVRA